MPASARRQLLFVQPVFGAVGGGEVVAAWMLQALAPRHDVTVLAWDGVDVEALNRYFGTSLRRADFRVVRPPSLVRAVIDGATAFDADPFSIQRYAVAMRMARRLQRRQRFDVALTAFNEADLGTPGIQYVHFPWSPRLYARHRAGGTAALGAWLRPWRRISGFSFERMRANLLLANSAYTARVIRQGLGVEAVVVEPPVPGAFPPVAWNEREDAVVCVGRLSRAKELDTVIAVVERVRAAGRDLRLHIAGKTQDDERAYLEKLRRQVLERNAWATLHEDPSRAELIELISRQRYGIHATRHEPFGIAVAEMIRAGCIVLTPRSGGQVEITGGDERLVFDDAHEGARKLERLLSRPDDRETLRAQLAVRATRFGTDAFVERIRELVESFPREPSADRHRAGA